jgi:type II secretory pathway pseudopilin PulG
MKKLVAFTLAEVLIVLGIVGIIAQETIPTLVNNVNQQSYVTSLKKSYTTFNEALVLMAIEYNCIGDLQATGVFDSTGTATEMNQQFGAALLPHFKSLKTCGSAIGCFSQNVAGTFNGSGGRNSNLYNNTVYYKFIAADGAYYSLESYGECHPETATGYTKEVCGTVSIDVNGEKGPNNWGRDVFLYYITNGKGALLYAPGSFDDPWSGSWRDSDLCDTANFDNWNCASRIIDEGWAMNY